MTTVILCGGKGTRAYPHTVELPKPLLEVAGCPILRHVIDIYAAQGCTDFLLAAGFKIDAIRDFARTLPSDWRVRVVDTGEDTNTGGRVARCREHLDAPFFLTYADGVGNVDLRRLSDFHRSSAGLATVTVVRLPSPYGTLDVDGSGRVSRFIEKPILDDHWINAGFFVISPEVFDEWEGEDLEREVLPALCRRKRLFAYRHHGFWKSMDTYKDAIDLTAILARANERKPPWLIFESAESS